ncbi:nuclease harbi1 [Lasius niger]|uniref:Nuclease harbi1 n=3 Tax=Lasius TaxID=488720 RepID=A0A0J7K1V2_LASNI|nr:nuclease harbi1 [Lasius niger]
MKQEARKKRLKNMMKRMRIRLRKLCLQQKNKLLVQWSQMTDPKPPTLILDGIQYQRRIWTKERSNDFWQRIVGEHFTLLEWLATFRMSKETFTMLCDIIRTELEPKPLFLVSRQPLSVEKQVAIALYKLASCAEYRVVGDVMGVHKSTVRKCLFRVTMAINNVMVKNNIFMPSEDEAQFISLQFKK